MRAAPIHAPGLTPNSAASTRVITSVVANEYSESASRRFASVCKCGIMDGSISLVLDIVSNIDACLSDEIEQRPRPGKPFLLRRREDIPWETEQSERELPASSGVHLTECIHGFAHDIRGGMRCEFIQRRAG